MSNYFPSPTPGNQFRGSVIPLQTPETSRTSEPGTSLPATTAGAPKLDFRAALARIADVRTAELVHERDELIAQMSALGDRCNLLLAREHAARIVSLREQHKAIVPQCRAARTEISQLLTLRASAEGALRNAQETSSKARVKHMAVKGEEPRPEDYATEAEIKQWETKLDKATAVLSTAEQQEAACLASYLAAANALVAAQGKLNTLAQEEADLRDMLAGKPVVDHRTGLLR